MHLGNCGDGHRVGTCTKADYRTFCNGGDQRGMAEVLTRMNVRQMHLDHAAGKQGQRITKRNRRVCKAGTIDDDPVKFVAGCLNGVDQNRLGI